MKRYLAACVAVALLTIPLTASADSGLLKAECAEGYIHYLPFCFTPDELTVYLASLIPSVDPGPSYGPEVDQWRPLVIKYWPAELVPWAMAIIKCESGGAWWADNDRSTARGLFQFLKSTWDRGPAPALGLPSYSSGAPYNAEWNIQAAAWLYANWGGRSQWQCKSSL